MRFTGLNFGGVLVGCLGLGACSPKSSSLGGGDLPVDLSPGTFAVALEAAFSACLGGALEGAFSVGLGGALTGTFLGVAFLAGPF